MRVCVVKECAVRGYVLRVSVKCERCCVERMYHLMIVIGCGMTGCGLT